MEAEYGIIKCPTCGHERQGPRIVRLTEQHKKEWNNIQSEWHRYINWLLAILFILMILGVCLAVILSINGGVMGVLLGCALGAAIPIIYAWFPMSRLREKRLAQVSKKETEIFAQYGAEREKPFEII